MQAPNLYHQDDEVTVKELFVKIKLISAYLIRKSIYLLLIGFFGGLLGVLYAYSKKPVYVAKTTFVLEEGASNQGGLAGLGGIASMVGIDVGGGGGIFQGDNILELYKSRTMIAKTLMSQIVVNGSKQLLIERYIDFNNLRDSWIKQETLKDISFTKNQKLSRVQDSILTDIAININNDYLLVAKLDKKLSIITAEVSSNDELFSKAFNEKMVQNVNDFYVQTKTKKSLENVNILQQKTDSVRTVMSGAIYQSATTLDATPNLNLTRQVLRASVQRSQFSAETNKAVLVELVKNLELSKINLRKETPLIQVIDSPVFPLAVNKVSKIKMGLYGAVIFGLCTIFFLSIIFFIKNKSFEQL